MKAKILLSLLVALVLSACNQQSQKHPPETLNSLKTTITGELTANAKYLDYAEKARSDSMPEMAALFHAAGIAEKAHADRQITTLLAHGGHFSGYKPEFATFDIEANIKDAIAVENYEAVDMYPGFIEISKKEHFDDVTESFEWALKAEVKHRDLFKKALASLTDPSIRLPKSYMICPRCGNTMDAEYYSDPCDICENEASKFVKVD